METQSSKKGEKALEDRFGRKIDYLRISVTDRCNLRCLYCLPPEGIKVKPRQEILRFEEILEVARVALGLGISRFRLTGGEPLVRLGIIPFIKALALLPGVEDVSLTTNGTLLPQMGKQLKESGVRRLNISLDTLDRGKYQTITRGGDFRQVWSGISHALELGFEPVKINVVALRNFNEGEWVNFARLTLEKPLHVRFIELMPIGASAALQEGYFASCREIKKMIESSLGRLVPVNGTAGNGPARNYNLPGAKGIIGFIDAVSNHFCASCNRLRLTADGKLRPCLHGSREVDLREALRSGAGDEEIRALFERALMLKPADYHEVKSVRSTQESGRGMCQIGG